MIERCFHCDEPTGRAGQGEDSLYDCLEDGPYCPNCWRVVEKLNDRLDQLQIELRVARELIAELELENMVLKMPAPVWYSSRHRAGCGRGKQAGYFTAPNGNCPTCGVIGKRVCPSDAIAEIANLKARYEALLEQVKQISDN